LFQRRLSEPELFMMLPLFMPTRAVGHQQMRDIAFGQRPDPVAMQLFSVMIFTCTGATSILTSKSGQNPRSADLVRVLVVDDFEPFRRFTCSAIRKQVGFQVVGEAVDGAEAVQRVQELKPDLVVMDIGLPKLNGIDAARRIRIKSPDCKILFLTGNDDPEVAKEAFEAGAQAYVVKMDAAAELQAALASAILGTRYISKRLSKRIQTSVSGGGRNIK
jgi:CheY-like chemotaxis protein